MQQTQAIQVVRVELTDVHAMKQLSQERDMEEYNPCSLNDRRFLLPANVDRFLYSPEAMEDLQKQVQTHPIEDAHVKIIKHRLLCPTTNGMKRCFVPVHVATSFRYSGTRITGSYFVSMLHTASSTLSESKWNVPQATTLQEVRYPLSPQERQSLIEYYMRTYLDGASSCTDFTVIGIPARTAAVREKSPTHRAFSHLAVPCSDNNECLLSIGRVDMYMFAHNKKINAVDQARKLLSDRKFLEQLATFGWSLRIFEKLRVILQAEQQTPEYLLLRMQQVYTVLEWIRVTWKDAATQV